MFKNRKMHLFGALVLIAAVVMVTLSAVKPPVPVPSAIAYSDYFQRHPEINRAAGPQVALSDYALRHSELSQVIPITDSSDFFLRHPELSKR